MLMSGVLRPCRVGFSCCALNSATSVRNNSYTSS
jgi:hypothetical protein